MLWPVEPFASLAVGCSDDHVPAVTEELLSVDQLGEALAVHKGGAVVHDFESANGNVEEAVQRLGLRVLESKSGQFCADGVLLEIRWAGGV